jgi:hypothetical protein
MKLLLTAPDETFADPIGKVPFEPVRAVYLVRETWLLGANGFVCATAKSHDELVANDLRQPPRRAGRGDPILVGFFGCAVQALRCSKQS